MPIYHGSQPPDQMVADTDASNELAAFAGATGDEQSQLQADIKEGRKQFDLMESNLQSVSVVREKIASVRQAVRTTVQTLKTSNATLTGEALPIAEGDNEIPFIMP